jgi:hypothetical protein
MIFPRVTESSSPPLPGEFAYGVTCAFIHGEEGATASGANCSLETAAIGLLIASFPAYLHEEGYLLQSPMCNYNTFGVQRIIDRSNQNIGVTFELWEPSPSERTGSRNKSTYAFRKYDCDQGCFGYC